MSVSLLKAFLNQMWIYVKVFEFKDVAYQSPSTVRVSDKVRTSIWIFGFFFIASRPSNLSELVLYEL